jgi:hypothetical protein
MGQKSKSRLRSDVVSKQIRERMRECTYNHCFIRFQGIQIGVRVPRAQQSLAVVHDGPFPS